MRRLLAAFDRPSPAVPATPPPAAGKKGNRKQEFYDEVSAIAAGTEPIVFGPFFTEIGFEVLYWIPFLNWFKHEFKVPADRLTVISRGGARSWYRHITDRYFDVFDHYTLEEFKAKNEARIEANRDNKLQNPSKHRVVSDLDRAIVDEVCRRNGIGAHKLLHPAVMFKYMDVLRGAADLKLTRFEHFRPDASHEALKGLPADYIAVKFWFGGQFREAEDNKRFVRDVITAAARASDVVLLNTGLEVERTEGFDKWFNGLRETGARVHSLHGRVSLRDNLDAQTAVIAKSRLFLGTYGGFAYVAPFAGVPAMTFYSDEAGYVYDHLEMLNRALRHLRTTSGRRADFTPFDVASFSGGAGALFGLAPSGGA
jgi:hypothetical protein